MVKKMMFYIFIYIFIIGCDGDLNQTCPEHYLIMEAPSLNIDDNGYYHMTFLNGYSQTFSVLEAETGSTDKYQKLEWISNKEIKINGYWINLINQSSYTNDNGIAKSTLGVWQEFIGDTIKIYCGYNDNCNIHYVDSLEVIVE
jgi:hypothetical protein